MHSHAFDEILAIAENERFPYGVEQAAAWMQGTCMELLQLVAAQLTGLQTAGQAEVPAI